MQKIFKYKNFSSDVFNLNQAIPVPRLSLNTSENVPSSISSAGLPFRDMTASVHEMIGAEYNSVATLKNTYRENAK